MKKTFIKFCEQINFHITNELQDSLIRNVNFTKNGHESITEFEVSFFSIPTKEQLEYFLEKSVLFFQPSVTKFNIDIINKNYSLERIYGLLAAGSKHIFQKQISDYLSLDLIDFDLNTNTLNINFDSLIKNNDFKQNIDLDSILSFFNINDLTIVINNRSESIFDLNQEIQQKTDEILFKDLIAKRKEENKSKVSEKQNFNQFNKFKKQYFKVSMEEFYSTHEQFLLVEGKIFSIDKVVTRTNLQIITLNITDEKEAIPSRFYVREKEANRFGDFNVGEYVSIFGEKRQDNTGAYYLQISKIEVQKKDKKVDQSEVKRIEFSARSSMSPMDGFISAPDLLKHAKQLGHSSIAIIDYQNIQAFPDIYNSAKKIGIKPIYGSTFSIITKDNNIIWNHKENCEIKKERYVIFDLETTSLNPRTGEIIEFGALTYENGQIVESIQFFIKPSKPISKFTTELTGISQRMVDEKALFNNQEEALKKILAIFSDATLVAHNAMFDIGYIKEKMYQFNLGELKNQIIDTLGLAKFLIPVSQSYRLEVVAKKLNVLYDPEVAHRADYDAAVLQRVWLNMIDLLETKGINDFEQIKSINDPILHDKKFGHDLAIYARNQNGLKELFKLVSQSLTNDYYGGPKLFEDELLKLKSENILIAPTSINSKLIDLMQTGTTDELEKEIDKWDFIGIPSPHLFSHLVARNNFNEFELKEMLREVIYLAKKKGKIIIAIGDVRYLENSEALAHSIYINTKGLEGRRHHLYRYNEIDPKYPIQKLLTTQEMKDQFDFLNSSDLVEEIVVKNTILLDSMIEDNIEVIKSKLYAPKFDDSETKLVQLVYENAHKIYGQNLPELVDARIKRELEPIIKYGFSVVYWISQKLVAKSLSDGYLVGSRGSVGSSIVATLSGITEVNPLAPHYICKDCSYVEFVENPKTTSGFDLPSKQCSMCNKQLEQNGQTIPFETFLGFDGDKVPDIDLNFSGDYQPIIHQEVRNLFGENHTFRAGTIATVASKTAFGFVKKYFEEKGINHSNTFVSYLASKIEGSKRTTGQHPGGIIIIPKEFDVEDFTPINYPANDTSSLWKTTHFDFHAIHDNVLKLDLLGHDDPTAIRQLQKLTNVKISDISFSDEKVMKLFSSTESLGIKPEDINNEQTGVLGIPEFGTKFVRKMLKVAKPSSFNDLINISGLSHGTDVWTGNAEELVKQGKKLSEVISCRDDIMVYLMSRKIDPSLSFQIMERVRKGKGLTKEDEEILLSNGIEKWYIDSLNKIKYMFPKAHATAYVMMAWRIAWFKIYYPMEYYATFFTVRPSTFDIKSALLSKVQIENKLKELEKKQFSNDKLSAKEEELIPIFEIINEMLARGYNISNIDLYKSEAIEWKIDYENKSLIPPFIVIDGLGEVAAQTLVKAREEREFTSKSDLMKRGSINKAIIEKMEELKMIDFLETTDQLKLF